MNLIQSANFHPLEIVEDVLYTAHPRDEFALVEMAHEPVADYDEPASLFDALSVR